MGMAEEFRPDGVAFNALWPRTLIATAAVQNVVGGDVAMKGSRRPEIVGDAAHAIFTRPAARRRAPSSSTRTCCETGVCDFGPYRFGPVISEADLIPGSARVGGASPGGWAYSGRPLAGICPPSPGPTARQPESRSPQKYRTAGLSTPAASHCRKWPAPGTTNGPMRSGNAASMRAQKSRGITWSSGP
jgi:hypothetical protein